MQYIVNKYKKWSYYFCFQINSLLSSGEIPGLYSPEELEPFLAPLRERASNEGYSGNLVKEAK
jgi:hypothetical protein